MDNLLSIHERIGDQVLVATMERPAKLVGIEVDNDPEARFCRKLMIESVEIGMIRMRRGDIH